MASLELVKCKVWGRDGPSDTRDHKKTYIELVPGIDKALRSGSLNVLGEGVSWLCETFAAKSAIGHNAKA